MKVFCATFPRSGSQFMADCVKATIGDKLKWCESYENEFCPRCYNMAKTHDFVLDDSVPCGWGLVVQIRSPLHAIPSWFDVQVEKYGQEDTHEAWIKWADPAFTFWRKFVHKWILSANPELVVIGEQFSRNPEPYVAHVSSLILGGGPVVVPKLETRRPSSCLGFRYYDNDVFEYYEALCFAEMRLLGMKGLA